MRSTLRAGYGKLDPSPFGGFIFAGATNLVEQSLALLSLNHGSCMRKTFLFALLAAIGLLSWAALLINAQAPGPDRIEVSGPRPGGAATRPFGPAGGPMFGPGGPGGPGGPMGQKRELVKQFDKNGDGRLNREERQAAREFLQKERANMGQRGFGFRGGPGGPGGFGPTSRPAGFARFAPTSRPAGDAFGPPPGGPDGFGPPPFGPDGLGPPPGGPDGPGGLGATTRPAGDRFMPGGGFGRRGGRGGGGFGGPDGPGGFGPPGFGRGNREPAKPGPRISPDQVQAIPNASFYEPTVLRTLLLDFEDADWDAELTDFHRTDVHVPATLTVDGKKYPNVGVQFRGNTSFMAGNNGYKRPIKLTINYVDPEQHLYGYKTVDLLNSAEDPSFLHVPLYYEIARKYMPAEKANLVKVVINGESWGVYVNVQSFDKVFVKEWFKDAKGPRWKVPVNFRGDGGLTYVGENLEDYKRRYEAKSNVTDADWKALIALCRTLKQTPPDQLESALKPILDVEHLLWYLAIDNVLINNDGIWTRASDYGIFRDKKGVFHIVPHDVNETFSGAMGGPGGGPGGPGGPGGRGGPGGPGGPGRGGARPSGVALDPLAGAEDTNKAILNRLLASPTLRARYLDHVRVIAEQWLDWNKLGPIAEKYRSLIEKEVELDTRKLYSTAAFKEAFVLASAQRVAQGPGFGPRQELSLPSFAQQRRDFLLNHKEIRK